jgi:hypothetical protein
METLPVEIILQTILKLSDKEIAFFCSTNDYIRQVCKDNEDYIYKHLVQQSFGQLASWKEVYSLLKMKPKNVSLKSLIDNFVENGSSYFDQIEFYHKLGSIDVNYSPELIGTTPLIYLLESQADKNSVDINTTMRFIDLGADLNATNDHQETITDILDDMKMSSTHNFTGILNLLDFINERKNAFGA